MRDSPVSCRSANGLVGLDSRLAGGSDTETGKVHAAWPVFAKGVL